MVKYDYDAWGNHRVLNSAGSVITGYTRDVVDCIRILGEQTERRIYLEFLVWVIELAIQPIPIVLKFG